MDISFFSGDFGELPCLELEIEMYIFFFIF